MSTTIDRPSRGNGAADKRVARGREYMAVLPLLGFAAIGLGTPVIAILIGAFTRPAKGQTIGSFTTENFAAAAGEPYLNSLLTSVALSALCAAIAPSWDCPWRTPW